MNIFPAVESRVIGTVAHGEGRLNIICFPDKISSPPCCLTDRKTYMCTKRYQHSYVERFTTIFPELADILLPICSVTFNSVSWSWTGLMFWLFLGNKERFLGWPLGCQAFRLSYKPPQIQAPLCFPCDANGSWSLAQIWLCALCILECLLSSQGLYELNTINCNPTVTRPLTFFFIIRSGHKQEFFWAGGWNPSFVLLRATSEHCWATCS